jgi:para-nitrobenzyl esterase
MRIFKNTFFRSICLVPVLTSIILAGCGSDDATDTPSNNEVVTDTPSNNEDDTDTPSNNEDDTDTPSNNEDDTDTPSNNEDVSDTPSNNEVVTDKGAITGVSGPGNSVSFKGIPYAGAPVGENRFSAPVSILAWDETLQASEFGSDCPQVVGALSSASSVNEDCLFLNVYTPNIDGDHPVMVWIHGGDFISGSGGGNYQADKIIGEDVVLVTLNYRLGALGFLAHSELTSEMGAGSGNFGLMDQQLALQWVQDNIKFFGGNPENVTVFGESAGGHSVLSQMASANASGLFHKAIIQSGGYRQDQITLSQAEARGEVLSLSAGCNDDGDKVDCLRDLSVQEILEAQGPTGYIPNTGTDILPESIRYALTYGTFNKVPVIEGSNLNEGQLFVGANELSNGAALSDESEYRESVAEYLSVNPELDADAIASHYLLQQDSESDNRFSLAFSAIQTDVGYACEGLAQVLTLRDYVDTYFYHFTDENAPSLLPQAYISFPLGAAHAYEIQYLLSTEEVMLERGAGDDQINLANAMVDYWTTFAKSGNPNPESAAIPQWPELSTNDMLDLKADIVSKPSEDFYNTHSCSYWINPPTLTP